MSKAIYHLHECQLAHETRIIEIMACVDLFAWVMLLLAPVQLLHTNTAYAPFIHHSRMELELIIGAGFSLLVLGIVTRSTIARCAALCYVTFVYAFVAAKMVLSAPDFHGWPVSTGVYIYFIWAAGCAYSAVKLVPFIGIEVYARYWLFRVWWVTRRAGKVLRGQ